MDLRVKSIDELIGLLEGTRSIVKIPNGTFTLESKKSGEHRTFRIHTQPDDAKFSPGKRIIAILIGADNTSDYRGVAFLEGDEPKVWKRHQGTNTEELVLYFCRAMTEDLSSQVTILESRRCICCNRKLTTPESCRAGIGPICANRLGASCLLT
jgi:hypothetical protein